MKDKSFDYKNISQSDSVVVLSGGPSTGKYVKEIIEYINKNNSVV